MMNKSADIILKVNKLCKQYDLASHKTFNWFRKRENRIINALQDISFELKKGEVLGVIGLNGAGKSTLLKILSGITEPTSGRIEYRGRILSVLDVGTGFHPDLSGRENVFMNGEILGLTNCQIAAKFDEIVEFSEVGEFIDEPVKHYSSGMFFKIGFFSCCSYGC